MLSVLKGSGIRGQFVRYSLVGATGTVVDFGVFTFLRLFSFWFAHPALANCISFSCAVVNNFLLNKFWTFRPRGGAPAAGADGAAVAAIPPASVRIDRQFLIFLFVSLVGLAMNTGILIFVSHLPAVQALFGTRAPYVGKAIAVPIVWFWNFGANKLWTFRKG